LPKTALDYGKKFGTRDTFGLVSATAEFFADFGTIFAPFIVVVLVHS
jgi:hypothetical protein